MCQAAVFLTLLLALYLRLTLLEVETLRDDARECCSTLSSAPSRWPSMAFYCLLLLHSLIRAPSIAPAWTCTGGGSRLLRGIRLHLALDRLSLPQLNSTQSHAARDRLPRCGAREVARHGAHPGLLTPSLVWSTPRPVRDPAGVLSRARDRRSLRPVLAQFVRPLVPPLRSSIRPLSSLQGLGQRDEGTRAGVKWMGSAQRGGPARGWRLAIAAGVVGSTQGRWPGRGG